jgi:aquaporin Z
MPIDALIIPAILLVLGCNLVCMIVLLAARQTASGGPGKAARAAIAEGCGSFLLVLVGLLVTQHSAVAQGLTLVVLAGTLRPISGGHCHPAVTLGAALAGRIPLPTATGYLIVQFIGGIVAALVAAGLVGTDHFPELPDISFTNAALAAALLALVGTHDGPQAPLYSGAALVAGLMALAPAFNPAAWAGAALLEARLANWQAAVAPIGAAAGVGLAMRFILDAPPTDESTGPRLAAQEAPRINGRETFPAPPKEAA